ncbi:MAG: NADH-quinone oxidoreductase subunit J, partial [Pseudomonadota bacterium]
FLFVVMMLDINVARLKSGFARYLPMGLLVALAMVAQLFILIWTRGLDAQRLVNGLDPASSNTRALGEWLFTRYLYPFEVAGVILLVAIVAAISLTHRRRPETKYQDPSLQVKIQRDDRIRLVKMDAEPDATSEDS